MISGSGLNWYSDVTRQTYSSRLEAQEAETAVTRQQAAAALLASGQVSPEQAAAFEREAAERTAATVQHWASGDYRWTTWTQYRYIPARLETPPAPTSPYLTRAIVAPVYMAPVLIPAGVYADSYQSVSGTPPPRQDVAAPGFLATFAGQAGVALSEGLGQLATNLDLSIKTAAVNLEAASNLLGGDIGNALADAAVQAGATAEAGQEAIRTNLKAAAPVVETAASIIAATGGTKNALATSQFIEAFNEKEGISAPEGTSFDVTLSSTFRDVAIPTDKAAVAALSAIFLPAFAAPIIAVDQAVYKAGDAPQGQTWYAQNASLVGSLVGTGVKAYESQGAQGVTNVAVKTATPVVAGAVKQALSPAPKTAANTKIAAPGPGISASVEESPDLGWMVLIPFLLLLL